MAKNEENYTKIPNIILEDKALNVYEFRILMHIARQTIGYGKKSDGISLSQFVKATGIGTTKVKTTISELKKKKYVKVIRQTAKGGGKSYNRYNLTLSRHTTNHSHDTTNPKPSHDQGHSHDTTIQKKIEQKKIDKRGEREELFTENEKKLYIAELIQSEIVRNPKAYEMKIREKLAKHDDATIEMFKQWKRQKDKIKEVEEFKREYIGAYFSKELNKEMINGTIQDVLIKEDYYIVLVNQGMKRTIQIKTSKLNKIKKSITKVN